LKVSAWQEPGPVPRIPQHAHFRAVGTKVVSEVSETSPCMREISFRVVSEAPGRLEAKSDIPTICITAPTLEDLQYEAREALIEHLGPAHGTYRVRVQRPRCQRAAASAIRPLERRMAPCC